MIPSLKGWTRHFGSNLVTLYPPHSQGGGRIRYYERIRPLQSFASAIRFVLLRDPDFRPNKVVESYRLITNEGEYGGWTQINGSRHDSPACRFVGVVFADEFAAAIDALATIPSKQALLEQTAKELMLKIRLGRHRCDRRFFYQRPPGWQGIPSGLVANWYPPDFPSNQANIVVFPAHVTERSGQEAFESMLARAILSTALMSLVTWSQHPSSQVLDYPVPIGPTQHPPINTRPFNTQQLKTVLLFKRKCCIETSLALVTISTTTQFAMRPPQKNAWISTELF